MKFVYLFLLLLPLASCTPDELSIGGGPITEEITRGGRWNLQIGSPQEEVYARLQALGIEKDFDRVSVVSRMPYRNPSSVSSELGNYDALTLQSVSGVQDRIVLEFSDRTVERIQRGGGMLDSVPQWPAELPVSKAITVGDSLSGLKNKLVSIYGDARYSTYELILPDKPLARPYDPEMENYAEWRFTFFEVRDGGTVDRNNVQLHFKSGSLDALRITRERFELVY